MAKDSNPSRVQIVRVSEPDEHALRLLRDYYEEIDVIQSDSPEQVQAILDDSNAGMWIAYLDNVAVGCVILKKFDGAPSAGECKRLYVQAVARGRGIADRLLAELEEFARCRGLEWIYLDSHDGLTAAIRLYRKRGYLDCDRYNDNPQATVFLRKNLSF